MKHDSSRRVKLIVLSVVLLGLWTFIAIRYVGLSTQWKATMKAQHEAQAAALQAQAEQAAAAGPSSLVTSLTTPVAPPESDPFRPVIAPRGRGGASEPSQPASSEPRSSVPDLSPPSAVPARDRGALHVTGIINGNPNTAVLRLGEEHYVVREGYVLDNDVRVQTIGDNFVTLQDGQGTYILRLGH